MRSSKITSERQKEQAGGGGEEEEEEEEAEGVTWEDSPQDSPGYSKETVNKDTS